MSPEVSKPEFPWALSKLSGVSDVVCRLFVAEPDCDPVIKRESNRDEEQASLSIFFPAEVASGQDSNILWKDHDLLLSLTIKA